MDIAPCDSVDSGLWEGEMREIKFRAYHNFMKRMFSWEEIGELDSNKNLSLWNLLNNLCKDIVPMQYTGLTDKNGKEIYEGDVVRVGEIPNKQKVFVEDIRKIQDILFENKERKIFLEIIGNRFENPELLKD